MVFRQPMIEEVLMVIEIILARFTLKWTLLDYTVKMLKNKVSR